MLYLVATPIGNLGDITLRALQTLQEADIIAAEDTRHTSKLLMHYDIKKPLVSYHEHNKAVQGEKLIEKLKEGLSVALVTDAGTPGISDPGEDLVKLALANEIEVTMIPGAVAGIMGLVLSGFSTRGFIFEGFLPENKKKRREILNLCKTEKRTTVFYEAPHNLIATLNELNEYIPDRMICVCRELTKKYEEFKRGTINEMLEHYNTNPPKGEFVIVIEGSNEEASEQYTEDELFELVNNYIDSGMKKNDALRQVAADTKMSKNELYKIIESMKNRQ